MRPATTTPRHALLAHAAALLAYLLAALLLTWPLALHLGARYPAAPGEGAQDLWQNLWNIWWAGQALERRVNPFFTDALFHPRGGSLLFHPLNLTNGLLALLPGRLAGPVVAYNAVALLAYTLSGYAVFLLARRHGCGWLAALAGGLVYTGSAYHAVHLRLGHFEQIALQWLPLYALALDRLLLRPSLGRLLLALLALLAVVFTSLYMAVYAALLSGLWLVWLAVAALRRGERRALLAGLGGAAALVLLALALLGPTLLAPMAREAEGSGYMRRSLADAARGAAGPADVLLPPPGHPLRALLPLPQPHSPAAFVGFLPLLLAALGTLAAPRQAGRWAALALLAWLLSLGPALPLYRALYALPPIQAARYPGHFSILVLLGLAVPAALGAQALARALAARVPRRAQAAAGLALPLLLLAELYPGPTPLVPPVESPFYRMLAAQPGRHSLFELPINRFNNMWVDMAAQTIHGKPILYGGLARAVPRIPFERMALFRELERPAAPPDIVVQPPAQRAAALRFFGLRYLAYHRSDESGPVVPPSAQELARAAGVPVRQVYSDDQLVGFALDPPPPGPARLPPFVGLAEGWYNLEPGPRPLRWVEQAGASALLFAEAETRAALRLELLAYGGPRSLAIYLDDRPIGQATVQPWASEIVTEPFALPAGQHTLRLVPGEPGASPRSRGDGPDDRPLTIAIFVLELEDRS